MLTISNEYNSLKIMLESVASYDYEKSIADSINKLSKDHIYLAERPVNNNKYSDVLVKRNDGVSSWIEVKMDHHAGLGSPRVYYSDYEGGWCTTYKSPAASFAVNLLNSSDEAAVWITQLKKWLCSEISSSNDGRLLAIISHSRKDNKYSPNDLKIVLPTTSGGLNERGAVPVDVMQRYVLNHDRNIFNYECDITSVVEDHYLKGKLEPAHYIQIGDDLYRIGEDNPFQWGVPKLQIPSGNIIARISISSSKLYETQIDIKSHDYNSSDYSLRSDSNKMRPF